jgi:hypothetical protein
MILTLDGRIGKGGFMTFEQIVTYVIAPLLAGAAAVWALVRVLIPRLIEARLEGEKDSREHRQKLDELQIEYHKAESESTHQMMGSLLEKSQEKEEKANEFNRTVVFNSLDKIKTDTNHIPILIQEIKILQSQVNGLETRERLLIDLITHGLVATEDEPKEDYDTYQRNQSSRPSQEDT